MKRALLILAIVLAALVPGRSHAALVKITLSADAEVQPARPVALRDIATIVASGETGRRIGATIVATGPLPGERRTIQASYLRLVLNSADLGATVRVCGPEKVVLTGKCVRWAVDDLAQKAKAFLYELLPVDNRTYGISVTRVPRELVTAAGQTVEVRPRLLNSTARLGTNTVALEAFVDGRSAATTSVTLDVKAVADAMVATGTIRQGEALTSQNTSWARRDITRINNPIVATAGQSAPDYVARRTISAGTPITAADVTVPPVVRKGEGVTLVVTCGSVKLSAPAEARQDGKTGDVIRVSCAASREDVHARIIERGLVEVTP